VLAIAGSLAAKKTVAASPGTLPTKQPYVRCGYFGVIVIIAAAYLFSLLVPWPIASMG